MIVSSNDGHVQHDRGGSTSPRPESRFSFVLPHGYRDAGGTVHRDGVLRAARVADELRVLGDFRVYLRPTSFLKVALARTIVRLGGLERVDVGVVERLDAEDLRVLARLYRAVNGYDDVAEGVAGARHGDGGGQSAGGSE